MKKYILALLVFCGALTFQSCDYVTNPNESIIDNGGLDSTVHTRRVLVEDFTGHKCTACPQAAIAANQLVQTFGEKVIVIGVHAGFFATPTTAGGAPAGSYLTDFRTTAGDTYDSPTYFGVSSVGNPNGLINRKDYTPSTTNHVKSHTTWATEVAALLAIPPAADLKITNTYNASTRSLSINLVSEFLNDTAVTGTFKLMVMITQDSIVNWQLDAGTHVPNYVHRHVLRDVVNTTWGEVLVSGAVTAHSPITKNYVYTLPAAYKGNTCNENNCHVVAFIYNTANYEIWQAAEAKVIP